MFFFFNNGEKMPELPEVETVVRDLAAAGLARCKIRQIDALWPRTLHTSAGTDWTTVKGKRIAAVSRRGKFIVLELSGGLQLLIHLRMSGRLGIVARGKADEPYLRVRLLLDDARELRFYDPRKFGRWQLVHGADSPLLKLGPEPLASSFTAAALRRALRGRKGALKPLLLNQSVVAGLGNIYVDEALWEAGLHPLRSADTLNEAEINALRNAIRKVLRRAIGAGGTSLGTGRTNFYGLEGRPGGNMPRLKAYGRKGKPCARCGNSMQRVVVAQRGTHLCPVCQAH